MEYVSVKSILHRCRDTSWFGSDYNMNLYRGCCHGCIYCDSRSECYHIEDFDRVRAKKDAAVILRDELRRKRKTGVIGMGSMSDPYNPFERTERLTEKALMLIDEFGFGVNVDTKSALITRDAALYRSIAQHSPVLCKMTITAADDSLCRLIEPHVSASSERFAALEKLSAAGVKTCILMNPILPFMTDNAENITAIVRRAAEVGVMGIFTYFGVTLRQNQREYFYDRLDERFAGLRARYARQFGGAYECFSPNSSMLWKVFVSECEKHNILYDMNDITAAYKSGYGDSQLSFFD